MKEKSDFLDNAMALLKGREIVYYGVERGIFPLPNKSIVLVEAEKSNYQSTQSHQKNPAHQSTQAIVMNNIRSRTQITNS